MNKNEAIVDVYISEDDFLEYANSSDWGYIKTTCSLIKTEVMNVKISIGITRVKNTFKSDRNYYVWLTNK